MLPWVARLERKRLVEQLEHVQVHEEQVQLEQMDGDDEQVEREQRVGSGHQAEAQREQREQGEQDGLGHHEVAGLQNVMKVLT